MKLLVVIDMQNDFVTGSLGSAAAQAIVPRVAARVEEAMADPYTAILFTRDTHYEANYANTLEGKLLPIKHCILGTPGHHIIHQLEQAANHPSVTIIDKVTFGSEYLFTYLKQDFESIELCGLCTDICVVSNAIIARTACPNTPILVNANLCAGTSITAHEAALHTMASCQIEVRR